MKICMLTDAWMPVWGGGQEHVLQVSEILKRKYGHEVDIIAPTLVNPEFKFNNFWHRIWFTFWVLKFLLTSDYDLYHSHSPSTSLFLPLVKLRGKKTAITMHGAGLDAIGGGILNKTGIFKFLNWVVFEAWPYDFRFSASPYKNFTVVGNGVNVGDYDKFPKIKHNKFVIFWIGRKFDPIKGVKYLEEAVKQINNPKIELDIAEHVYGAGKIKRFKQADLFVLPSLSEGLPLVLLEAMAAKLPIVTTNVGECGNLVKRANAGLVAKPGDVEDLKKKILEIYQSKNRKKMGEDGHKFVKENYTWEKVVEKTLPFT